ncbi:MAG: aspartate-semialdehyde dehydrogenase [Methermicoccaceae archaeon]
MGKIKVGVLGATGAVGQRFVEMLSDHPWFEIGTLAASERSAGKKYRDATKWRLSSHLPEDIAEMEVVNVADPHAVDAEIVFSALPASVALEVEKTYASEGFVVASNASSHRMDVDVPLVIPEVNADHLKLVDYQRERTGWDGFIVTNPNCSTIMMTLALKSLMSLEITEVYVATMQAVSGAGFAGVSSMAIMDNVIPYIAGEEEKMEKEPLKLLGSFEGDAVKDAPITISASCNRVPVVDGHTESLWIKFREDVSPEEVLEKVQTFDHGLPDLPTLPEHSLFVHNDADRPQPRLDRDMGNGMTVSVGRIRSAPQGVRMVVLGHNTIRGASGASILNAELISHLRIK